METSHFLLLPVQVSPHPFQTGFRWSDAYIHVLLHIFLRTSLPGSKTDSEIQRYMHMYLHIPPRFQGYLLSASALLRSEVFPERYQAPGRFCILPLNRLRSGLRIFPSFLSKMDWLSLQSTDPPYPRISTGMQSMFLLPHPDHTHTAASHTF